MNLNAGIPSSSAAAVPLPPGTKFLPTDQELLGYYLYNHIEGKLPPHLYEIVRRHDLYGGEEPWEVWRRLQSAGGELGDVYFFAELRKKVKAGGDDSRNFERKVGRSGGSWHGEDTGARFKLVLRHAPPRKAENWVTGIRKRFNYRNPNLSGENGKWILHEFSLSKDPAGKKDICGKVLCLLRNNGSPSAKAVVDAARSSAVAKRKRDIQFYIDYLAGKKEEKSAGIDDSNKRRRSSTPPPPAQPQQQPPPSVTNCSARDDEALCSNPAPDSFGQSEEFDIISYINWDSFENDASTTTVTDSKLVLPESRQTIIPLCYGNLDVKVEEQPPNPVPPPAPGPEPRARPSADDKGKNVVVAAADDGGGGYQNFDTKEGILLPPCEMQGAGDNYGYNYYDYGGTNQLENLQGFDGGGGGFGGVLGMGLPFNHPWEWQGNGGFG
ncbi:unnamed protein product [Linum trigynum]|uniref:NAC domain-containing protein n=1 Tax=Linum trigynum TaxID=586398 RepID=A0AAV2FIF4_9ROSI